MMIAEKIKSLRVARGLTQAELARQLGITRNGVNSWEQGLSMPSPAYLVELAKLFRVTTDYLLGLSEMESINVSGLSERDIGILTELAERLKMQK
ncbi:helix-turn-helix domain-containing protein [Clostridium minihomine]|uniref:helix-turn-helix domain-containing protein n=1 Tax=Clostridium minihomine TaxID=2045012 RepID=UPI001FB2F3AA|nr:helix-turn-helix transcriptional regulator [Clostridium minihomine]